MGRGQEKPISCRSEHIDNISHVARSISLYFPSELDCAANHFFLLPTRPISPTYVHDLLVECLLYWITYPMCIIISGDITMSMLTI